MKNIEKIAAAVRYDLRQGIVKRFYVYLFLAVPVMMIMWKGVADLKAHGCDITFMNIMAAVFKGSREFIPNEDFRIPLEYMFFVVSVSIVHGWYVKSEFSKRGSLVILRMGDMRCWWIGKCVWGMVSVIIYVAMVFLGGVLANLICGNGDWRLTDSVNDMFQMENVRLTDGGVLAYITVLTVLTLTVITLLQGIVQLAVSPVAAMMINIAVMVASAFELRRYLIGNYLMLIRSSQVREDGVSLIVSAAVCMVILVTVVTVGAIYCRRKEML